jgi:dTDP-4-amino-4,6-dideoxygalactose transaminase
LRYGRAYGDLRRTDEASERVVRLPLWVGMGDAEIERVVSAVDRALRAEQPSEAVRRG